MEHPRSPKWSALEKKFLAGKVCVVCGSNKSLNAHHIKPYHLFPELELVESNLMALCTGKEGWNHHFAVGHLGDWDLYNPDAVKDANILKRKCKRARNALQSLNRKKP